MKKVKNIIFTFMGVGVLLAVILMILFKLNLPIFLLTAIVIFLCVGAGFLISSHFSGKLDSLYDGVQIVQSGNLEYKVNTYSEDGIGRISKEFDRVVEELRDRKNELELAQVEIEDNKDKIFDLEKKEDHFRRLFEQSNDAVFVYDFDGKIVEANNKASDMLGYPQEILAKVKFFDLQMESEMTSSKSAFKTGPEACAIRYESRMKRANKEIINVEISTSGVDMKKGVMQSIVRNITERKNMQKALEASEEKFRTFMETAGDLMFIADKDGKIKYLNNSMANSLGYLREEAADLQITDILSQESLDVFWKAEGILREKGEVLYEAVWETKHRKKIYGEITQVAMFNNGGEFTGARGIFRDITERKKVEESQRLANLGKLSADVAHEVNNPITIILARAEMLQMQRKDDKDLQEKMTIVIEQCEMAISIVKRLLKFSKPSKKEFTKVKISDMVSSVINLVEHQFQGSGIEIISHFDENLSLVNADEKQVQEVFMNLMRNASDAMPDGGKVDIYIYEKEKYVYVDFKDNGEGIAVEAMKKIFDPFFTTKKDGTGLGLSVCYGIMQAHNGELLYLSKPGEGTTARVKFPAVEADTEE